MSPLTYLSYYVEPSFRIGSLQIHYYGIIIALTILLAVYITLKRAHHYGVPKDQVETLFAWALIPMVVGARLYHVFSSWQYYLRHPMEIAMLWNGGLGIYGAIAGAIIGLYFGSRQLGLKLIRVLDMLAPVLLLGQGIGRWGNFLNQEGYGPPADHWLKIYIDVDHRPLQYLADDFYHPSFFYESALDLIGVVFLFILARKSNHQAPIFGAYLVIYGTIRFLVEFARWDTANWNGIRIAHLISVGIIILGLILVYLRQKHIDYKPETPSKA